MDALQEYFFGRILCYTGYIDIVSHQYEFSGAYLAVQFLPKPHHTALIWCLPSVCSHNICQFTTLCKNRCHNSCIETVSTLCELSDVLYGYYSARSLYHICYNHMLSHQYEFSNVNLSVQSLLRLYYNDCIGMGFLQCGSSCDVWDGYLVRMPDHNSCTDKVSLQYEFSYYLQYDYFMQNSCHISLL